MKWLDDEWNDQRGPNGERIASRTWRFERCEDGEYREVSRVTVYAVEECEAEATEGSA